MGPQKECPECPDIDVEYTKPLDDSDKLNKLYVNIFNDDDNKDKDAIKKYKEYRDIIKMELIGMKFKMVACPDYHMDCGTDIDMDRERISLNDMYFFNYDCPDTVNSDKCVSIAFVKNQMNKRKLTDHQEYKNLIKKG